MIGGQDIRVEVPSGAMALDFAVRAVRLHWPRAVFVANDRSDVITQYGDLEFHDVSEIIVYRDKAACDAWRSLGYGASLKGTMIYLISDPTDLTMVVEEAASAEIQLLVSAIKTGVRSIFRSYILKAVA